MALVKDVLDRAREVLNDVGKVRWTDVALMRWLNDALDLLAQAKPALFTQAGLHSCTAGAAQTLQFERVMSFDGIDGVLLCVLSSLDTFAPGWRSGTPGAAINWMPSPEGPTKFLLYPPSLAGQILPVRYVQAPDELDNLMYDLPVSDDYVTPLSDYVIGMAEAKDAEQVTSGRAQVFMQAFASKLGIKP